LLFKIYDNIQNITAKEKGDLLIFLSGISEITAVVDAAKEYNMKKNNWIVLSLHSTLSITEQDKVYFFYIIISINFLNTFYYCIILFHFYHCRYSTMHLRVSENASLQLILQRHLLLSTESDLSLIVEK
jgi:hypothetical protein